MGKTDMKTRGCLICLAVTTFFLLIFTSAYPVAQEIKRASEIEGKLVAITGDNSRRTLDLDIQFDLNSDKLSNEAKNQLVELGQALISEKLSNAKFKINGHTDSSGAAASNKALSLKRAMAVKNFLIEYQGISATRVSVNGYGEERLTNILAPNSAENRRVEIVAIYELRVSPSDEVDIKKSRTQAIQ
jgi:outer membrane protein OmpA-like peptidoglycan-associated protein